MCCMMSCACCIKKRAEVYHLRNATGIDNRHSHLRNSDENIPESTAERGETAPAQPGQGEIQEYPYDSEFEREEDRRMFGELEPWAMELRNRNTSGFPNPNFQNPGVQTPGVHTPHAQNLANTTVENEML